MQTFLENHLLSLGCSVIGGAVLLILPYQLSIPQVIAAAVGIFCGFWFSARVFNKAGVDVWITPMIFAFVFAAATGYLTGIDLMADRYLIDLAIAMVLAVIIGQVGVLLPFLLVELVRNKSITTALKEFSFRDLLKAIPNMLQILVFGFFFLLMAGILLVIAYILISVFFGNS